MLSYHLIYYEKETYLFITGYQGDLTTTILNREDLCRCLYLHIHALFIILKSHISNQLLLLWEKL